MLRTSVVFLLIIAAAVAATAQAPATRVAYLPISVEGDYQPLDTATANEVFLAGLKSAGPELEFVPVTIDMNSPDAQAQIDKALQTARDNGAELIAWGRFRFQRSAQPSRGDSFYAGRLKLLITAEADIQVANVADQSRILSQPTMVTSSGQSNSFVEDGDPALEKKLARQSLEEAAESIVEVVRERRAGAAPKPQGP